MSVETSERVRSTTPAQEPLITGEQLFAMADLGPCELVRGRIIRHMPTGHPHSRIEMSIIRLLDRFARQDKIGEVLPGEVGIITGRNPDTVRGADVALISPERFRQAQPEGFLDVAPELVVEVMSPSNTWSEAHKKLEEYFTIGVQTVWVVDPQLEQIHVYRSLEDVTRLTKEDELAGEGLLSGFQVSVAEIFSGE